MVAEGLDGSDLVQIALDGFRIAFVVLSIDLQVMNRLADGEYFNCFRVPGEIWNNLKSHPLF